MPRTVVITPNVRQRLRRYIYNITINPSVAPKFKVETFRRAIDKANDILNDLYYTLSNEFVQYKITQFNVLGRRYGYRQYQYKDKSSKTVWLFGCDTTPFFNFVMIMQNSRLCLSHIERQGNLITENKQYNNMNNTRNKVRLTESQLHNVIKESVKKILSELDWKTYANAEKKTRTTQGNTDYWKEKGEKWFDAISKAADGKLRAKRFGNAAKDAFDRDFGYQRGEKWMDDDYQRVGMGGDFDATEEFGPHAAGWRQDGVASIKRFPHGVYTTERTPEEFFNGNADAVDAYNKAKEEMRNYKKGNYNYNKGEGWKLK